MIQVEPDSKKLYAYGTDNQKLYIYVFTDYEESMTLAGTRKYSKEELDSAVEEGYRLSFEYDRHMDALLEKYPHSYLEDRPEYPDFERERESIRQKFPMTVEIFLARKLGLHPLISEVETHSRPDNWHEISDAYYTEERIKEAAKNLQKETDGKRTE